MSDKLTKAEELAKAVRVYYDNNPRATTVDELPMLEALAAYEVAPAESQAAGEEHTHPWPHDFQLAQWFHETYERLAPSFGYETRKDSAKPWEEVPEKNKKLMTAVCREILIDLSKAKLAAAQARIAYLEKCEAVLMSAEKRARQAYASLGALREHVAVLEKALRDARERAVAAEYYAPLNSTVAHHLAECILALRPCIELTVRAAQPSREKEGRT